MIVEKGKNRGYTFDEMVKRLRLSGRFHEFLRTAADTGMFAFDIVFATVLTADERAAVRAIAAKTPQLYDFDPLPIADAIPRRFGPEATTAKPVVIPELDEYTFYRVAGGGCEAVVQARPLLTLVRRHPNAVVRFKSERPTWKDPVTFVDGGRAVGIIMPVKA